MKKIILILIIILSVFLVGKKGVYAANFTFNYDNYNKKITIKVDATVRLISKAWITCTDINNSSNTKTAYLTVSDDTQHASGEIKTNNWNVGSYLCHVRMTSPKSDGDIKVYSYSDGNDYASIQVAINKDSEEECSKIDDDIICRANGCSWGQDSWAKESCHKADYVGYKTSVKYSYDTKFNKLTITALDQQNGIKAIYLKCTKDGTEMNDKIYIYQQATAIKTEVNATYSFSSYEAGQYYCTVYKNTGTANDQLIDKKDNVVYFSKGNCDSFNEMNNSNNNPHSVLKDKDGCLHNGCYVCNNLCVKEVVEGEKCLDISSAKYICSEMDQDECESTKEDINGELVRAFPGCFWDGNKCKVNLNILNGEVCKKITDKDECNTIGKTDNKEGICKWNGKSCVDNVSCKGVLGGFADDLNEIIKIFRIVAPLLVIGLSTYEYIVAVTSKDAEGLKKANDRLIKRLILVAILFFLPTLVDLLLGMVIDGYSSCIG